MNRRTKLIGTIAIGALLVAPAARADDPRDWPGSRSPGAIAALESGIVRHPDNRAGPRGPGAIAAMQATSAVIAMRPDDRSGTRGPSALTRTSVTATTPGGFDWGDAMVGGVGGMGAALLLVCSAFLLVTQRHRTRTAA